jgi:hypothetical protein
VGDISGLGELRSDDDQMRSAAEVDPDLAEAMRRGTSA